MIQIRYSNVIYLMSRFLSDCDYFIAKLSIIFRQIMSDRCCHFTNIVFLNIEMADQIESSKFEMPEARPIISHIRFEMMTD